MEEISQFHQAEVDYDGLLEVLGKNLYSTPEVVVRELVQNAHDSCTRRALEQEEPFEPSIQVETDSTACRLTVTDRGAGLTHDEVNRYLATLGAGYTRLLREQTESEGLIGAFGLGFLSCYLVSDKVEVFTTSYQTPEQTWRFSSRNGQRYTLGAAATLPVGTTVVLHLKQKFKSLADGQEIGATLRRYCGLLSIPIHVGSERINEINAPWRDSMDHESQLAFASAYESWNEPMCCIPIKGESDQLKGLLWIHDQWSYATSDNRRLAVYIRGMLVSDNERDLLPVWAGFVSGVVESSHLVPTASRETLQKEEHFQNAAEQLRQGLIEGLAHIAAKQPAIWRRVLTRHNEALLGAALADERLFNLLNRDLKVPTSEGELTMPMVLKRGKGKVYVSTGEEVGADTVLYRALGQPVIKGTRFAALPFSRRYAETHGASFFMLGTKRGNDEIFSEHQLDEGQQQLLEDYFAETGVKIRPTQFQPAYLPLVAVPNREAALRRRMEEDEADKRIGASVLKMARVFTNKLDGHTHTTLFINLNSPLIKALLDGRVARPQEVAEMARAMAYSLSGTDEDLPVNLSDSLCKFYESFERLAIPRDEETI